MINLVSQYFQTLENRVEERELERAQVLRQKKFQYDLFQITATKSGTQIYLFYTFANFAHMPNKSSGIFQHAEFRTIQFHPNRHIQNTATK